MRGKKCPKTLWAIFTHFLGVSGPGSTAIVWLIKFCKFQEKSDQDPPPTLNSISLWKFEETFTPGAQCPIRPDKLQILENFYKSWIFRCSDSWKILQGTPHARARACTMSNPSWQTSDSWNFLQVSRCSDSWKFLQGTPRMRAQCPIRPDKRTNKLTNKQTN